MGKNIFNYATKELSQDAFLMYIIDCFNSENEIEKKVSRKFIKFLVGLDEDEEILNIWLKAQWHKIDISVYFYTKNQIIALFIEDKTTSQEHNQLKSYTNSINKVIERDKNKPATIKKIFYKTNVIEEDESARIKEADWIEFSIERIYEFWKDFLSVDHMIIQQYARHIVSLYNASKNSKIPRDNNLIAWLSFFKTIVEPAIINDDKYKNIYSWCSKNIYNYAYLCFSPKINMPYLEIRSRDCLNGVFNAKILNYGVEFKGENANGLDEIREIIKNRETNNIFKGNYGEKHNKQVAHTEKDRFKVTTEKEFIEKVKLVLDEYLDIVSFWK